ncbi:L,D-transpeptidase family protein [Actinacidiphila yeochonensis]|uniref:L,D-transpeptidase family protein n=1 Tax=Actinacidiphila yeochonensis TaxID=89050 RepID=UPI000ADEBD06|nr:L,D-transpeptidase family protein [Actinacidiphila yeochonensis]
MSQPTRRARAGAFATVLALSAVAAAAVPAAGTVPGRTPPRTGAARGGPVPLPPLLRDDGGGTQLVTATAATTSATTGTLTWYQRTGGVWRQVGSAPVRFGAHGLAEGGTRVQGTGTTPTGLYGLPFAFGGSAAPAGTTLAYRRVTPTAWWCEDSASAAYNRWTDPLPTDCRGGESEHLADYPVQYARAVVIGFNYAKPVKDRGAGIFLHVNGAGATAGCVSVPAGALARVLAWLDPARKPHIAIGTTGGATAVTGY